PEVFADVMAQLGIVSTSIPLMVTDRTAERHRAEIRELLGFREATVADAEALTEWLRDHAVADTRDIYQLTALLEDRCRELQIEPPAPDRAERAVRGALSAYDEQFCDAIHGRLSGGNAHPARCPVEASRHRKQASGGPAGRCTADIAASDPGGAGKRESMQL